MTVIGKRLRKLRKSNNMSQDVLAKRLSLTRFTVSSYENDKTEASDETIKTICKLFKVSADFLLGLIDEPLPFERSTNTITLPHTLPKSVKDDIREYAEYRIQKINGSSSTHHN